MKRGRWSVGVVVPARNEELTITACIDSILASVDGSDQVASCWIVVVADGCQDQTIELAKARLGNRGEVVAVDVSAPGVARRLGVDRVLQRFANEPAANIWIANTDADSEPHPDWIAQQLVCANEGYAGVAGVVRVASIDGHGSDAVQRWRELYLPPAHGPGVVEHPHVHGANLGFRADAYLDAGGWSELALAEDHCLWGRVRACGWRVVSSVASVVTTSGRLNGRAAGGFADTLRRQLGSLSA
jgi:cellulose synthase/poly-beta-1,6-N-acetylglucosamine synthase-like glycosyltransferase